MDSTMLYYNKGKRAGTTLREKAGLAKSFG